ncbi:MAG: hypothetical protein HC809_04755 [Gammaproteobacteria bacterium]|nr:hypothetical protein [Gammaproteobacteria bacterium]
MAAAFKLTRQNNVASGPMRHPRNLEQGAENSIHNDEVAGKLGMRGGTVAGNYHMEQFPPLLTAVLGQRWWQSGNLSLYYKYATTDSEGVQAFAQQPSMRTRRSCRFRCGWIMSRANAWPKARAAVGAPDPQSALRRRIAATPPPKDIRILADLKVGQSATAKPFQVTPKRYQTRMDVIVEPMTDYTQASSWGAPILPPSLMVDVMYNAQFSLLQRDAKYGVGLFGGIELQIYEGPMFPSRDYDARIKVLAIGETPQTEYFWYESISSDPKTGRDVAGMLMMLRFMKASSPLWK